jgi:hypothetical protein
MNSMVSFSPSALAHQALRSVRPGFFTRDRLRELGSDIGMVVAVLAFVWSFVALRMTLFAPADVVERVAIPAATSGAVVFVLALVGSLALRPRAGHGPNRHGS